MNEHGHEERSELAHAIVRLGVGHVDGNYFYAVFACVEEIIAELEEVFLFVLGQIALSEDTEDAEFHPLDHIHMIGRDLTFTFEIDGKRNRFLEVQARVEEQQMQATLRGSEDIYGRYLLLKNQRDE